MRKTTNKLLALLLTLVMVLGLLPITAFAAGEVQISQVSDKSVSAEDDSVGLPHAVIGQPYSVQFTAAGGTAPYTWDYALAYLPEGLTLDPATGVLSGTPTAAYSGTPTIVVEDSNNNYDSIQASLFVYDSSWTPTITATLPDGMVNQSYNQTVSIDFGDGTVSAASGGVVAVTEVSLNKSPLTLNAGESETLTAIVAPDNATDKTVNWESSNTAVATVSNGTVTAVAEGTATITVTTVDGNKTATCTVTVSAPHTHTFATVWSKDEINHWHAATCEHMSEKKDEAAHTFGSWAETKPATETTKGEKTRICSVCGYVDKQVIPELTHTHSTSKIGAVESTCKTRGNNEYYSCDGCGKFFKDAASTIETNEAAEKLALADHTYGVLVSEVAATESATGMRAHYQCSVCSKFFTESKVETTEAELVIPKLPVVTAYTITFDANGGNCSTATATANTDGKLAVLPTATRSGYTFNGWFTAANGGTKVTTDTVFTADTTIYAQWTKNSSGGSSGGGGSYTPSTYSIIVDDFKHGEVTVSKKNASKGDTVTLTVDPNKGYTLETLTVTDKNGKEIELTEKNGKYTFTMPASKVTIEATFMEDNTMLNYFVDVAPDAYYYDAVLWAAEKGITSGTDAVHFSPNASCSRAQVVTFLWRAAGSPVVNYALPFTDVPADSYYADAVRWAVSEGITSGTSATTFGSNATCSRAQIVTLLYRANGLDTLNIKNNPFTDVTEGSYYYDAVLWAAENGITGGTSADTFSPGADCTRAQIVTFLYRYMGK